MKEKNYIIYISFLFVLNGCMILFPFHEPNREDFDYTSKKVVENVKYDGLYAFFKQSGEYVDKFVIQFAPSGEICFEVFSGTDSLLDFAKTHIQKQLNNSETMNNKGFYYFENDIVMMEILQGDPGHGYYFVYYEGELLNNGSLIIKQTGYRKYKKAMDSYDLQYRSSELLTPKVFKFYPF